MEALPLADQLIQLIGPQTEFEIQIGGVVYGVIGSDLYIPGRLYKEHFENRAIDVVQFKQDFIFKQEFDQFEIRGKIARKAPLNEHDIYDHALVFDPSAVDLIRISGKTTYRKPAE